MPAGYSRRSPAVKRLMKEAQELKEPTEQYFAQPLEDNLFEWHFTVRGPPDSDFAHGVYHGRITLPPEYPMKPPSIMLLTPTGRFEVGTKICLSISGHHPETWQPSWSIRTVLLAIIGFMPTKGEGAIGSLDYTPDERKVLARKSQDWRCDICGTPNRSILPEVTAKSASIQKEAAELASQIQFKKEEKKSSSSSSPEQASPPAAAPPNPNPVPPGELPPNPLNMWQHQAGMRPMQPQFMPFSSNYMLPGQAGQFGLPTANNIPQTLNARDPSSSATTTTAPLQSQPAPTSSSGTDHNPTAATNVTSSSSAASSTGGSQSASPGSNSDGVRQRTSAAAHRTPEMSAHSGRPQPIPPPATRGMDGLLGPLLIMSIFSLIIVFLIFRRLYIMYEYKFT